MIIFLTKNKVETDTLIAEGVSRFCEMYRITPPEYRIVRAVGKKPLLSPAFLNFSVTHSGEYTLVGVSEYPIGIDIELKRTIDYKKIAERFFSKFEAEVDKDSFFALWTAKEARFKEKGGGLLAVLKERSLATNYELFSGYCFAISSEDKDVAFMPIFI